jgi:hypothetical protein
MDYLFYLGWTIYFIYYQWNVEHPSYDVGPDHVHTDENSRIMQNPISPGKRRRLHPNETHPPDD